VPRAPMGGTVLVPVFTNRLMVKAPGGADPLGRGGARSACRDRAPLGRRAVQRPAEAETVRDRAAAARRGQTVTMRCGRCQAERAEPSRLRLADPLARDRVRVAHARERLDRAGVAGTR